MCRRPRATREDFDGLVSEFMSAVKALGHVMVQFEDFGNTNAFRCCAQMTPPVILIVMCISVEQLAATDSIPV
jgi:hypothetical protein